MRLWLILFLYSCQPLQVEIMPSPEMIEKQQCADLIYQAYDKGYFDALTHKQ